MWSVGLAELVLYAVSLSIYYKVLLCCATLVILLLASDSGEKNRHQLYNGGDLSDWPRRGRLSFVDSSCKSATHCVAGSVNSWFLSHSFLVPVKKCKHTVCWISKTRPASMFFRANLIPTGLRRQFAGWSDRGHTAWALSRCTSSHNSTQRGDTGATRVILP